MADVEDNKVAYRQRAAIGEMDTRDALKHFGDGRVRGDGGAELRAVYVGELSNPKEVAESVRAALACSAAVNNDTQRREALSQSLHDWGQVHGDGGAASRERWAGKLQAGRRCQQLVAVVAVEKEDRHADGIEEEGERGPLVAA